MGLDIIGLAPIRLNGNNSVKNVVIQILADEWPLTVKEIFKRVKREFGKNVTYQATHKVVHELLFKKIVLANKKEYFLNTRWLNELETFSNLTLDKYSEKTPFKISKQKSQICKMRVYDNPDMFYKLMIPLLRKEKELRFSSKSPSLIISREETQTPARREYVNELRKAIEERNTKIKYLISSKVTKDLIIKNKDNVAIESLKKFSNNHNTKIKCAPTKSVMSYAVTKRDLFINPTAITHFSPVAVLHLRGKDMTMVQKMFDIIFAEANETNRLIEEIEKELKKETRFSS